jgi:hypothetical protein
MADMKVTVPDRLTEILDGIRDRMSGALEAGVLEASEFAAGEIRKVISALFNTRTGDFARSFRATILEVLKDRVRGGAFSDKIFAKIQDEGGTIKPKNMRSLAVPISHKAKTTVGLWPRHWPKKGPGSLHFIKRKVGPPLLVEFRARQTVLHYVLKKSVRIKPTGYLAQAADAATQIVEEILHEHIHGVVVDVMAT